MPQSPSPYTVNLDPATGYHYFHTGHGLIYACGFHDLTYKLPVMLRLYDIEINDFEFFPHNPTPEIPKPQDVRVSATLSQLIQGYFTNEHNVLIYLCDASDGQPQERQILFKRWHRNMADIIDHNALQIEIKHAYGTDTVYGGVITRKDFPHKEVLQHELIDNAKGLIVEKFGR